MISHRPECTHVLDAAKAKTFRARDGLLYRATEAVCRKCGERVETCLLVPSSEASP